MPTVVQLRRGTTAQNDAFTGAIGELSYDITTKEIRTHDGSTQGGQKLATKTYVDTNAFSGAWDDVTGKPVFAPVATSGSYSDLTGAIDLTAITSTVQPSVGGAQALGSSSFNWSSAYLGNDGIYLDNTYQIHRVVEVGTGDVSLVVEDSSIAENRHTFEVKGKILANEITTETDIRIAGASEATDGTGTLRMVQNQLLFLSSLSSSRAFTPGSGLNASIGTSADPWSHVYSESFNVTKDISGSQVSVFSISADDTLQQLDITPNQDYDLNLTVSGTGTISVSGPISFDNTITVMVSADVATDVPSPVNGMIVYNEATHKFQGYANGSWVDLH